MRVKSFSWTAEKKVLRVAQDDIRICHPEGCSIARRIWGGSEGLKPRSFAFAQDDRARSFALLRTTTGAVILKAEGLKNLG